MSRYGDGDQSPVDMFVATELIDLWYDRVDWDPANAQRFSPLMRALACGNLGVVSRVLLAQNDQGRG